MTEETALEEVMRLIRDKEDWTPTEQKQIDKLERALEREIAKILRG